MRIVIIILFTFVLISNNAYSKDLNSTEKQTVLNQVQSDIDYDSIWCFYPFSINIYTGLWTPLGKLNNYFDPSLRLRGSFGLMLTPKIKLELGIGYVSQVNTNEIGLDVNDSIRKTRNTDGASLGGWITYNVYKDKLFYIDLLSGVTWETIDTDIDNPDHNPDDEYGSKLSVNTYGVSFGSDIWINVFGTHNVGIRLLYTYADYNRDEILKSEVGVHSLTTSLIYRFYRRKQSNRRFYY